MSGILSYPRAAIASDRDFLAYMQAIEELRYGSLGNAAASDGLVALQDMIGNGRLTPPEAVDLAVELRDLAYAAWLNQPSGPKVHWEAMLLCSEQWPKYNGPLTTGFAPAIQVALALHSSATSPPVLRTASEALGTAAVHLAMSALMGQDLSKVVASSASIGGTKYVAGRNGAGDIIYLEAGAAYNTNIILRIDVPGCAFWSASTSTSPPSPP